MFELAPVGYEDDGWGVGAIGVKAGSAGAAMSLAQDGTGVSCRKAAFRGSGSTERR